MDGWPREYIRWSAAEDVKLRKLVTEHGRKWIVIAAYMEGRTVAAIKNRHALLCHRDRIDQGYPSPPGICYDPKEIPSGSSTTPPAPEPAAGADAELKLSLTGESPAPEEETETSGFRGR